MKQSVFREPRLTERSKYLLLVGAVTCFLLYSYGTIRYTDPSYATWDLHDYRAMANVSPGLTTDAAQPFIYRILGPYIAGLLPLPLDTSFALVTYVAAICLMIIFYLYLCALNVRPGTAALGAIFFALNKYLFGFPVWNFFQSNDILSGIELVLLLWMMMRRRWPWFGLVLFLGGLTRESAMLMIPVAGIFLFETRAEKNEWYKLLASVLPGVTAVLLFHLVVHPVRGNDLFQAFVEYSGKLLLPETWFRLLINAFLPFSLVPVIYYEETRRYFRERKFAGAFFILVLLSTFFGYNDERLMAPAFIVFYPLLATIIDRHFYQSVLMIIVLIATALLSNLHHLYARFLISREFSIILSILSLVVVSISVVVFKLTENSNDRPENAVVQ